MGVEIGNMVGGWSWITWTDGRRVWHSGLITSGGGKDLKRKMV